MSSDIIDRLRAYDPAADVQALSVHDEVERIVRAAAPAPSRARPRVRPRLVLAGVAAAAVAAALVAINVGSGGSPDLAAKAYAQTNPGRDVLYVRTRTNVEGLPGGQVETSEQWLRGDQVHTVHRITFEGKTFVSDQVLGSDDVLHIKLSTGEEQTVRPTDRGESPEIIRGVREGLAGRGMVAQYRVFYERGKLRDEGAATFAGHAARRYATDLSGQPGDASARQVRAEYYLDAQTGAPLGAVVQGRDDKGTFRFVETVEAIDHLPPTPENLAKLGG
jgi:hypothetical protein